MFQILTRAIFSLLLFKTINKVQADDFPSLLMANASIAILLDREYLDTRYDSTLTDVKIIVERVLREDLKNGGLIVTYYSWTSINFKRDFTAILSVANCIDTWRIFREARQESLLFLSLTDPDCPRMPLDEAIMIPVMKAGEELPQVVLDIKSSHSFNWKAAVVLHDDSFDRDMISRVAKVLFSESPDGYIRPVSIALFKIKAHVHEWERRKSMRKTLMDIPTKLIGTNFIAIVTTNIMEHVMETAKDLRMVDPLSKWLYIISDTNEDKNNISSVTSLIGEGENIAFAYNLTRHHPDCVEGIVCHIGELLQGFVLGLSRMIREEQAVYGQISDEEWEAIRPTKKEKRDRIIEVMKDNLLKTSKCSNCTTWRVQAGETWGDIYDTKFSQIKLTDDEDAIDDILTKPLPKLLQVGYWKPTVGFQSIDALFPHVNYGFRNKTLHIVTYHNPPWQIISHDELGHPKSYKGVVIDILNELSRKLNFTYTLHISSTNMNLINETDETRTNLTTVDVHFPTINIPTEIVNAIGGNKVLLAAIGATVNERYSRILNFSIPISIQSYSFIVSRPKELSRIYLFLSPFAWDTWLCLAFSIAFMSPLLYLMHRFSPYYEYHRITKKGGLNTMNNCFWYIYGALLQQGGMYLPLADSGRVIVGTWWIVVLIVVTTYCGNLVAYLTFPKIEIPITTINQLLRHEDTVSWGIRGGTFLEEYLKETEFPKHKRLFEGAKFYAHETPDIIDSVRHGRHVYIDWKSNLQYIMKKEFLRTDRCDFSLAGEDFLDEQISIVMPQNSPYIKVINKEIKRMLQMGFIQKWLKEYLPKKDRCWNIKISTEITNHTVNIDDMQGCFLVLLIGIAGSIFLIIVEYCWKRHRMLMEKEIIKPFVE